MLKKTLKEKFGFLDFRPGQEEVIQSLLNGHDTLAILPTGTGKSLCYQMIGYIKDGLVIIISPLISLMEDQVLSLIQMGEKRVVALNAALDKQEKQFVLKNLNRYKFLLLSPEMLEQSYVMQQLQQQKIALFVIDEAHCVSQWGMDFRPEYRNIKQQRALLGNPLTLALTASAPQEVKQDVIENIFEGSVNEFIYSVDRPNIAMIVEQTKHKFDRLTELLPQLNGSGIIYCATRKQVESLYNELKESYAIGFYHGGLKSNQRRLLQQQFTNNQLQILIATNAFGMGINKSDIDFIIHYDLPDSLENYLQEIGRAGRDGRQSVAILLYQKNDERIHYFFQQTIKDEREHFKQQLALSKEGLFSELQKKWLAQVQLETVEQFILQLEENERNKQKKLNEMLTFIKTTTCRRDYLLQYFDEEKQATAVFCCDIEGVDLTDLIKTKQIQKQQAQSWQKKLLKIFKDN